MVFDELKLQLLSCHLPIRYVAYRSGVDRVTIMKWLSGVTSFPRIDTMVSVATVLGQHVELTPTLKKMVAYYPRQEIKPPPMVKLR